MVWPVVAVAVATVIGLPPLNEIVGELQPAPLFVMVTPVTTPPDIVATAVGVMVQPEMTTEGVEP